MHDRRRHVSIRTTQPVGHSWREVDIAQWLSSTPATAPASPIEKLTSKLLPSPPPAVVVPADVQRSEPTFDTASDPAINHQLATVTLPAAELLSRCQTPTHDPLSGWSLDINTLQVLLIQCPIIGSGASPESLRIIGDTNLAAAILSRLPADYPVTITLYSGHGMLLDRLDFILRAPTSTAAIERELSRHTHLLPGGTLSDSDVAAYLGVSESAIRKARSRKGSRK